MFYLGIDQSYTSTGCVIIDENQEVVLHNIISSNKEDDIITRARFITDEISKLVREWKPKKIALEGLSYGSNGNATRDLGGLLFLIINKISFDMGYEVVVIAPPTLKKFATGNGRSQKIELFNSLPHEVFCEFKMNYKKSKGLFDVVDAYWLSNYVMSS